jgi:uncharacterized protein (UPF0332 family)
MNDQNQALIQYRLKQATETLIEAEVLLRDSLYRGVANRTYYAMFYAVLALATSKKQIGSKHSGMIAFFDREFVKTGVFQRRLSKMLHLAFDRRQANDYGEQFAIDQKEAEQAFADAKEFVECVSDYFS